MKTQRISAYLASALVLLVAGGFYGYSRVMLFGIGHDRYPITAQFFSATGLVPGGSVVLSGVPVGVIRSIHLNTQTYMAEVHLEIDRNIQIPKDSSLSVGNTDITQDDVVLIQPGKSKEYFTENGYITNTQEALSIEQQISNYIFGGGNLSAP